MIQQRRRGTQVGEKDPARATLNPRARATEPARRANLRRSVHAGLALVCHAAERARKDPRPEEKGLSMRKKKCISIITLESSPKFQISHQLQYNSTHGAHFTRGVIQINCHPVIIQTHAWFGGNYR